MNVLVKIKETLIEYAVLTVLGLVGLLLLILWQAVPSTFWTTISDATPKSVLWSLLGLTFLIIILETVYILQLHRKAHPKLQLFSGVLWDKRYNLYCPKDETLLFQSGRSGNVVGRGVEVFKCPKCDNEFSFRNSNGALIYFKDAKERFINQATETIDEKIPLPEPLSESQIKILQVIARDKHSTSFDDLEGTLNVHHTYLAKDLDELVDKDYLYSIPVVIAGQKRSYNLTTNGRKYLVDNRLV